MRTQSASEISPVFAAPEYRGACPNGGLELQVSKGGYRADDNSISFLDACDRGSGLHDNAHTFVANRPWYLAAAKYSMVYVQVTATDGGGGDPDDGVSFINNPGFGDLFYGNLEWLALPAHGLHSVGAVMIPALVCSHDDDLMGLNV